MLGSMIIVWLVVPIVITHSFSFILLNSGEPLIISLPKDLTGFVYLKRTMCPGGFRESWSTYENVSVVGY